MRNCYANATQPVFHSAVSQHRLRREEIARLIGRFTYFVAYACGGQMKQHLTMPDQMLALLKADAAHLDQERCELIRLRDQVGQSARRKNQRQPSRDCESVEVPMFRRKQN
jgi:hypothetical protein